MKCENCGAEFNTGSFCPNCGAKCNEEASGIKSDIKVIYDKRGTEVEKDKEQTKKAEKMPWCFSIWFIIIISILTFWIFWIPGVILAIIRFLKYKEKRGSSAVLALLLGIPCGVLVFALVSELVSASKAEKQLNAYIENGQYAEAQELIDQEYAVGTLSYVEKSARLYELQGMYDEAVNLWVEYCNAEYKPIDIPDYRIDKLNGYVEKYGSELQSETVDKIQTLINNKELARAKEKAEKEAKEAEEKAEKEAKKAEEKAAKEAKEAEEKAAKEATLEPTPEPTAESTEDPALLSAPTPEGEVDIDAVLPDDPDYRKYIHVGYTYELNNGGTMEILDAGYGYGTIYVLVEFTSSSDEGLSCDQSDAVLYIDDYEVPVGVAEKVAMENGYIFIAADTAYPTAVSVNPGGRKATIVFISCVPDNISETAEVEFDIIGGIFKVNPLTTGQAKKNAEDNIFGTNTSSSIAEPFDSIQDDNGGENSIVYGTYLLSPNETGGHSDAEVSFYTDADGGDYVSIDSYEDGSIEYSFIGYLQKNGNSYIATDKYGISFRIAFTNNGMNVQTTTGDADDYEKTFIGNYKLTEKLNLNSVS